MELVKMIDNYMNLPEPDFILKIEDKRQLQQYISENLNGLEPLQIIGIWEIFNTNGYYDVIYHGRV